MDTLLTGSSGFFWSEINSVFPKKTQSLGRSNSDIFCDLAKQIPQLPSFSLVIHAAGKAHSIPRTPQKIQEFFDVNVKGTKNLLKGLEQAPSLPKSFVFISSVAVYGLDSGTNIKEDHPLNAKDPYGLSKIQAEEIVRKWCAKNNVICTILRLPLLVGKNPPGNLGEMIKGIKKGYYFNIAGGLAKKSMVMAEDVVKIILPASDIGGIYHLTDGYHPNFKELSTHVAKQLNKTAPLNIPLWVAIIIAKIGDLIGETAPFNTYKLGKITADLTYDDTKVRAALGWDPTPVLEGFKLSDNAQ